MFDPGARPRYWPRSRIFHPSWDPLSGRFASGRGPCSSLVLPFKRFIGRITMPTSEVFSGVISDFLAKIRQLGQAATAAEANLLGTSIYLMICVDSGGL